MSKRRRSIVRIRDESGIRGWKPETRRLRETPAWVGLALMTLMLGAGALVLAAEDVAKPAARRPGAVAKPRLTTAPLSSHLQATPIVPLHEQIDRLIEAKLAAELPGQSPAAPATDAEFLRRVWFDLAGMIPDLAEARAFLDDPSPYKRPALIDRLLESTTFARRMEQVFDVMLMERRPDLYVPGRTWREFLHQAFAENRPYDLLVRQILAADGTDPATRPAARFTLDREADPNVMTRDVGRLFLGMDLQCCQCHDHPLIDGFKQQHYYGLYAFFNRTVLVGGKQADGTIKPGSVAVLGEKADGEVSFSSVFRKKVSHKTGPRVLDGPSPGERAVPKGQEYLVPPDKEGTVRPVPVISRRALLGSSLTSPGSPAFARNIVNRLWALLMGRGIVHPLDLHHDDNTPSHPELLNLLVARLVDMKYDIKSFLRELTLTRVYQRSSEPPPDSSPELAEPARFAVAAVRPTSPEQLAWSVMQAVGLVAVTRAEVQSKLDGVDFRMNAILNLDGKRRALRETIVDERLRTQLERNVRTFVRHFGGVAGQAQDTAEATSTVDQALFITNGEPIKSWLKPAPGWLIGRLNSLTDPSSVAEELYLALLSRRPSVDEHAEVAAYLAKRTTSPAPAKDQDPAKERIAALRELAWGLLASTEFRFNH
jgi:hypothetical protein